MHPVKQRARDHRKREREHVRSAKHFVAAGDYGQAIRYLAWAIQQQGAADVAETCLGIMQAREAMATVRTRTPRDQPRSTKK